MNRARARTKAKAEEKTPTAKCFVCNQDDKPTNLILVPSQGKAYHLTCQREEQAKAPPPLLPSLTIQVKQEDDLPACYTEESPLIIDNTILSTVATCSTKSLISYHHHLVSNEDSNPLLAGQAAHKALELFFKGGSAKDAMKVFQDLYYPYGNLLAPEEGLSWENTSATMETYLAGHALDGLSFVPIPGMIEGAITAPLWKEKWGKRVIYLGLVDLLVQERATGLLSIMDHKTTSRRVDDSWVSQFKTSAQLSGYVWLSQQSGVSEKLDKALPISSAYINTIGFSRLPVSDRKCARHSVPYVVCRGLHSISRLDGPFQRSPLQLEQWLANARDLTKQWAWTRENHPQLSNLRAAKKEGMYQYQSCLFCPYQNFCDGTINDGNRLPQFFQKREWKPWGEGEKKGEKNGTP